MNSNWGYVIGFIIFFILFYLNLGFFAYFISFLLIFLGVWLLEKENNERYELGLILWEFIEKKGLKEKFIDFYEDRRYWKDPIAYNKKFKKDIEKLLIEEHEKKLKRKRKKK